MRPQKKPRTYNLYKVPVRKPLVTAVRGEVRAGNMISMSAEEFKDSITEAVIQ